MKCKWCGKETLHNCHNKKFCDVKCQRAHYQKLKERRKKPKNKQREKFKEVYGSYPTNDNELNQFVKNFFEIKG